MKNGREAASALKKRESECFKDGNRICIKILIYITYKASKIYLSLVTFSKWGKFTWGRENQVYGRIFAILKSISN